jgi:beta-glucosidase/6-phospho-beta-glucosidase/beta-galactosidase
MIRRVAYIKAILAGAAGAVAAEALVRLLVLAGLPIAGMVDRVGAVVLPGAGPWQEWAAGMALHLLAGAIWGLAYAYFFFSLLPLHRTLQGLAFSLIPLALALVVLRPQLELMLMARAAPWPIPWRDALSLTLGHLAWGAVLGTLYHRPVGHLVAHPPRLAGGHRGRLPPPALPPHRADDRFMFATGIECSYPTVQGGRWRMDQMEACGHYRHWRTDLALVREMGLRHLRYGPPLHLMLRGPRVVDWSFMDEVAEEMRRLEIVPIIDLCHFGVPDWLGDFQNPELPQALAEFARDFARRYPWVRMYTPVNEMYVCTKLSALDGLWNEQRRDETAFVTAVRHVARASVLMEHEIVAERPDAIFVHSESGEFYQPCCPDPEVMRIAAFENERRFLPLDLLYAHPVAPAMRAHLAAHGMPDAEYDWFMRQSTRARAVLGVDYYVWNEKLIDTQGRAQTLGELFGWYVVAQQYWQRYRRPLMHTETNHQDAREGPRWLWRQWHNVQLLRQSGVPIVGFTWYSLTDQVDWNIGLAAPLGNVNPVGLFDLNRDPRLVGQAYRHLVDLFGRQLDGDPTLDSVLQRAAEARRGA